MATKNTFKNKTWDWATYSAHLVGTDGFFTALNELVTNAIDAVRNCDNKRIDISYDPRVMLKVEDSGCGMTKAQLAHAMRYADSSKLGPNNQFGTGIKTAFSFFDKREGGGYSIYTRTPDGAFFTEAPFGEKITIKEVAKFPAEDWVSTVIKTAVTCQCPTTEEIEEKLRFFCTAAIMSGIVVRFNGTVLTPIVPGKVKRLLNGEKAEGEDIPFKVEGGRKYFSYTTFELDDTSTWRPMADTQGVYIFYNKRYICHEGIRLIPKANGSFSNKPKLHNEYNSLVTFVFIEDETKQGKLTLTSCKTAVDWESNIGSEYRSVIGNAIKAPYTELKKETEALSKQVVENALKRYLNGCAYIPECSLDESKQLRADGVIIETASIHDARIISKIAGDSIVLDDEIAANGCIKSLIEYKTRTRSITCKDVGQLIGYIVRFKENYGYVPENNMVVGASISDEAKAFIASVSGIYNISFEQYP